MFLRLLPMTMKGTNEVVALDEVNDWAKEDWYGSNPNGGSSI